MEDNNEISYKKICQYLNKDQILAGIIQNGIEIIPQSRADVYEELLYSIISQQLSTKVARIIRDRFKSLFADGYPEANELLAIDHETLRSIGMSNAKANYAKNVAQFSLDNDLSMESILRYSDNEIIELLTQIKGVGVWTVQMMLMFTLDRKDVLPLNDLGIQNGMQRFYNIEVKDKKTLLIEMEKIAEAWRPYRSLACKYIWQAYSK